MKPILKYPGGKWRESEWIISHFPQHKNYVEPFFGGGAIFFRKQPVEVETINDIDSEVVNLFKVCRDNPDKLAEVLYLTPVAREEYNYCLEPTTDTIEKARRLVVRFNQSFAMTNKGKTWRCAYKVGGMDSRPLFNRIPKTILECADRLKNAQIENMDALELIKRHSDSETLIYCDPPYVLDTCCNNIYDNELTNNKHLELVETLKNSKCKIVLSGYDNEIYNNALKGWNTATKSTLIQQGKKRVEKIWYNYATEQMSFFDNIA